MTAIADSLDLPAADYLPHEPPLLLVQRLRAVASDTVACETAPDAAFAPFANPDGSFPVPLLLEVMAQTVGVWAGWHARAAGRPPQPGLILGCRGFSTTWTAIPPGARLRCEARKIFQDDATGTFEVAIAGDGAPVASATLTTRQITWPQLDTLLAALCSPQP
ncbi:3-hydroxy-fatty acyl-ACP dehydratase [Opitutaceae bacterium TAV5]|nr:3-hydroxy-fatty acyl-ACP dehydratase [Opitutaceae bacterium TAV5]